jgi:thiamine-phosphate pyrophosphorylase
MREKSRKHLPLIKISWTLCLVADVESARGRNIIQIIRQAAAGGATLVQLRAKKLSASAFLDLGRQAASVLREKKIPLVINDRPDIALACGAAGVHLGQEDLPVAAARQILGKGKLIGRSIASLREARKAEKEGADYVGLGPVFPTPTKDTPLAPLGLEGVGKICRHLSIPVLAIGGITRDNARQVIRAGADGIAVVSAILGAPNIFEATRELKAAVSISAAARKHKRPGKEGPGRRSRRATP